MTRASWEYLVWAVALVVLAGCPGTETGLDTVPVSGTATLDGQPVAGAAVTFKPKAADGRAAVGVTDASGRFALTTLQQGDGALPGGYFVGITKTAVPQTAGDADAGPKPFDAKGATPSEEQKSKMQQMMKSRGRMAQPATAPPKSELPEKYASPETTGFTAEVKPGGENDFTFAMTSE